MTGYSDAIRTEIIPEYHVDAKLDAAIKKTLCICFPHVADNFALSRKWHGSGPVYSIIVPQQNVIIAHLGVVDRTITIANRKHRVAGVQNVCVLPGYRGKGYSDAVLNAAMKEAERRGFEFGLLFTDDKTKHVYERNGWIQLYNRNFTKIENDQDIKVDQESVNMYYPITGDFPPGPVHLQGNDW